MPISDEDRRDMLAPEIATVELPGIGGAIKSRPEDFVVDEIAAYAPDGTRDRHLFVRLRKRDLTTPQALRFLAEACGLRRADIGVAGRKDARAVTTQWVSLPAAVRPQVEGFTHDAIEILEVRPHSQKLRRGHLKGNRFDVVLRALSCPVAQARQRVEAKLRALDERGGLENLYGEQRFGDDGANLEVGLAALRGARLAKRDLFVASAAQSGLFNLYVALRRRQGWLRQVLPGDVVQRTDSGGMFVVDDPVEAQDRLARGELVVSGPIFGAKMRTTAPDSPAEALELEVLRRGRVDLAQIAAHGRRLPGSRRACTIDVGAVEIEEAPAVDGLAEGLRLRFTLPAGSYATQLLRELCGGARVGATS